MATIIRAIRNVEGLVGPLIFLAGPIKGAIRWQEEAITTINGLSDSIHVASPRAPNKSWTYEEQVDWETKYLNRAAQNGLILFWLAKECKHICSRAYAQTSRFELGEWKERSRRGEAKLVVGIEPGFTNERYLRRRLSQDCPNITIHQTLLETCQMAVTLLTT